MRYSKNDRYRAFIIIKSVITVLCVFTFIVAFLAIFGEFLVSWAVKALFEVSDKDEHHLIVENVKMQGFEEDFLTFTELGSHEENIDVSNDYVENDAIAVNLSALSGKYKTYKGTSIINNTDYSVSDLLYANYKLPELDNDKPYVLIYHTHTSESYYNGGTVVDVGEIMTREFEKLGFKTIHLKEVYDKEQFSGAYSRSIKGVERILKENPSIRLVFDVHRDSITTANGDIYRPLTTIDGKNCAQVMFVCGTDSKGLSHPHWKENFKFALDVSRTMGDTYGSLSRPVNLRADRFNTHVTNYAFLMEMGSDANTLEEAQNAAIYTVRSVVKTISE